MTGYSIELHYCKGELTDIAFFGKTACNCESEKEQVQSHKSSDVCKMHCHQKENSLENKFSELEKKGCCKTEKLVLPNSKLKAVSSANLKPIILVASFFNLYSFQLLLQEKSIEQLAFIPPLIARDITNLTQVYRI